MLPFRLTIMPPLRPALQRKLTAAETPGELRLVKWILALFAVAHWQDTAQAATVYQLPSYSPHYHPIEKLWKQVQQAETHLVYGPTFEALREKVETALVKFARRAQDILRLCGLPTALARAA